MLPADIVFANHALLEAMSYGVVPLISNQPGSDLIVDDNVNGFIFEHNEESMESAMQKAMQLTDEEHRKLSQQSRIKMQQEFSVQNYEKGLKELYSLLG